MSFPFDAICITSASANQAQAYQLEFELRRRLGAYNQSTNQSINQSTNQSNNQSINQSINKSTLIVAVPDPSGQRVGSGGATLNALSIVAHRLCLDGGYQSINHSFLSTKRILILHSGGDSQRIPMFSVRGKAFSSLPSIDSNTSIIQAPIDLLIKKLSNIFVDAPIGGCVISATDVLLLMPDHCQWRHTDGITGIGIFAATKYGHAHGVYVTDSTTINEGSINQEPVTHILQKASIEELKSINAIRKDDTVIVDSGILYLSSAVTASLIDLSTIAPLDSCTDAGMDGGNQPMRFELYTDIILTMNPSLTREQYLAMPLPSKDSDESRIERARKLLWKHLRQYKFYVTASQESHFSHVGTTSEYLDILNNDSVFRKPMGLTKSARSFVEYPSLNDGILINSVLLGHGRVDSGALVENSLLRGNFYIDKSSVVSGIRSISGLRTAPSMVVQEVQLSAARVRADARLSHLLGKSNDRSNRDQPFFFAPQTDATRFVDSSESTRNDPVLRVVVLYGVHDGIKDAYKTKQSTLCNRPWSHYFPSRVFNDVIEPINEQTLGSFTHLQLDPDDDQIWDPSIPDHSRSLWNARIYPVLVGEHMSESILWMQYPSVPSVQTLCEWKQSTRVSLQDILALSDAPQEFYWRARASFLIDQKEMESILLERRDRPLLPIIARCQPEYKADLLESLDAIASAGPLDVCARTLCTIADVLASLPGTHLHTRTGPARNPQWAPAIAAMANASTLRDQSVAVKMLAAMRTQWLKVGDPQLYMRAARHYDGAWASLTKKGVETLRTHQMQCTKLSNPALINQTVEATSPVRIDLMGGWSDTPPICFEHGGAVANVAINVDGAHPIGASAKVFVLPPAGHADVDKVIIVKTGRTRSLTNDPNQAIKEEDVDDTVYLRTVHDLHDYNDPTAPAALVKCVLLALKIVDLNSQRSLAEQLALSLSPQSWYGPDAESAKVTGTGLYVRSWSVLPQGTGLGVSSILAGDIIAAVAACFGQQYDLPSLMHLVLLVEQMLSTGGGWQDQAGGLYPAFKFTTSADRLPLLVKVHQIDHHQSLIENFNQHILLIHTGQSRLAKNLLGNVLRRWYQRDEQITSVVDGLVKDAESMRAAIEKGDLLMIGTLFQRYWAYKQVMATPQISTLQSAKEPSVEPNHIKRLSKSLSQHVHGLSLLGAGGGGFMAIITIQPITQSRPIIQQIIDQLNSQRQQSNQSVNQSINQSPNHDEFDDDWPAGDYALFAASVCEQGLTVNIVQDNQLINQPINQSVNQSINQSIN